MRVLASWLKKIHVVIRFSILLSRFNILFVPGMATSFSTAQRVSPEPNLGLCLYARTPVVVLDAALATNPVP